MSEKPDRTAVFSVRRVASVQTVINFEPDEEVILKLGSSLLDLSRRFKAEIVTPSIPENAPPNAPRAVIKGPDTTIIVSLVNASISLTPPSHVQNSFESTKEFHDKRSDSIFGVLDSLVEYDWSGVVVDYEYPAKSTDKDGLDLCAPFFDSMLNVDRKQRRLASFQLSIGFTERGFHRNFSFSGYETREFVVQAEPGQKYAKLETADHPISEAGMKLRVDINNRSRTEHEDQITELAQLWEEHRTTYQSIESELGIEEVLR